MCIGLLVIAAACWMLIFKLCSKSFTLSLLLSLIIVFQLESKKRTHTSTLSYNFGRIPLLTAITHPFGHFTSMWWEGYAPSFGNVIFVTKWFGDPAATPIWVYIYIYIYIYTYIYICMYLERETDRLFIWSPLYGSGQGVLITSSPVNRQPREPLFNDRVLQISGPG